MLRTLRGFLPWIAFAVVNGLADWRVGAIVAVALSVLLLVDNARTGHGLDEAVIESSAAIFFVVIALIAFAAPGSSLQHHTGALAAAWLAVTAWGSVAIRKPFTLGIARRSVPEQFWHNPLFLRANMLIASVASVPAASVPFSSWLRKSASSRISTATFSCSSGICRTTNPTMS